MGNRPGFVRASARCRPSRPVGLQGAAAEPFRCLRASSLRTVLRHRDLLLDGDLKGFTLMPVSGRWYPTPWGRWPVDATCGPLTPRSGAPLPSPCTPAGRCAAPHARRWRNTPLAAATARALRQQLAMQ
jgi:hypothetical protein